MALFLPGLQIITALLLIAAGVSGFYAVPGPQSQSFLIHFLLGCFGAIMALFVHSMVMFYFIGSGKGMKDALDEFEIANDSEYRLRIRFFKKTVFPKAFFSILLTLAAGIIGGGVASGMIDHWIHLWVTLAAIALNLFAFPDEYKYVKENGELVKQLEQQIEAKLRQEQTSE